MIGECGEPESSLPELAILEEETKENDVFPLWILYFVVFFLTPRGLL